MLILFLFCLGMLFIFLSHTARLCLETTSLRPSLGDGVKTLAMVLTARVCQVNNDYICSNDKLGLIFSDLSG